LKFREERITVVQIWRGNERLRGKPTVEGIYRFSWLLSVAIGDDCLLAQEGSQMRVMKATLLMSDIKDQLC
jgi:hypothetical protein